MSNHNFQEQIKDIKKSFKKVSLYYNTKGKDLLNSTQKNNFKLLHNFWSKPTKEILNNGIEDFFALKEYHTYINCTDFDKLSDNIWKDYIEIFMKFRINLMMLSNSESIAFHK